MAKNNVGSLYFEILLSPNGYKTGAAAIRKEDRDLQSHLVKAAKDGLSEREKVRAEAERASKHNWKKNADNPEERARVHKVIVESAKRRLAEIAKREKAAADASVALAKKEADKKLKIEQDLADKKRELAIREKSAMKKRHYDTIQGLKKLIAKQKALDAKALAERTRAAAKAAKNAPRGGMMGAWDKFQGIAGKIGTVTMAVWPLVQVFKTLSNAIGMVGSAFMKVMEIVDRFKMQTIKIAKFLKGDMVAAKKLTSQVEDYAIATSLSVDAGMDMAASLLVLGVNADHVAIRLKQFNSVAMGNEEMFKRIAKAYTDVLGAGVLKATEMRQFTESGAPIREALTAVLEAEGRFTGNLQQMISDRLITARDVSKAMDEMGKMFKGLDLAALETVSGQIENIQEEFVKFMRHSGLAGEMNGKVVELLKNFGKLMKVSITAFGRMQADTSLFTEGLDKANTALKVIENTMRGVMRLRSWWATGDKYAFEKEWAMFEKLNQMREERAEKRAKKEADVADAKTAREKKAAENQANYEKALFDLQDKRNEAQKKYDEWRKSNKLDSMSEFEQRSLNNLYYYQQMQEASEAKTKAKDDMDKAIAEKAASRMEAALNTALPQDAFKQNSVEEFRYMQEQRKQAERDARDQERFDKKTQADYDNAKMVADAVGNIEYTNTADTAI